MRTLRGWVLAMWLVGMHAASVGAQAARSCPHQGPPVGDLGIVALRCAGPAAACAINLTGEDGAVAHRFSVEPVIDSLSPAASARGDLRVGDRIVSLDGRLITTREGGRHFAALPVDGDVTVMLRRGERLVSQTVRTSNGCGVTSLTVTTQGGGG